MIDSSARRKEVRSRLWKLLRGGKALQLAVEIAKEGKIGEIRPLLEGIKWQTALLVDEFVLYVVVTGRRKHAYVWVGKQLNCMWEGTREETEEVFKVLRSREDFKKRLIASEI